MIKSQPSVIRKAEARMQRRFARELRKLGKRIAKAVEAEENNRALENDIETMINMRGEQMKGWFDRDMTNLFTLGARYINKAVGGEVDITKINLLAVKRVKSLKTLSSTAIDGSINKTTFTRIREILADGIFDGKSYTEMGASIYEQLDAGVFSPKRAELIAINRVGNAYEQGRSEAMKDLKRQGHRMEKIRDTVGDEKVTPECRHNEAQGWIPFEANRPSGDSEAPRESNPRCRCSCNYKIL